MSTSEVRKWGQRRFLSREFVYESQLWVNAKWIRVSRCKIPNCNIELTWCGRPSHQLQAENELGGGRGGDGQLMTYLSRHIHHGAMLRWVTDGESRLFNRSPETGFKEMGTCSTLELFEEETCVSKAGRHVINNSDFTWNNKMEEVDLYI